MSAAASTTRSAGAGGRRRLTAKATTPDTSAVAATNARVKTPTRLSQYGALTREGGAGVPYHLADGGSPSACGERGTRSPYGRRPTRRFSTAPPPVHRSSINATGAHPSTHPGLLGGKAGVHTSE